MPPRPRAVGGIGGGKAVRGVEEESDGRRSRRREAEEEEKEADTQWSRVLS
jgi:hypothetical protein